MQRHSLQSGFTLIELLVSMTIFSFVMALATSTLLILIDANSKAQNVQILMSDVTIGIDSMAREIRTGYNYYCDNGRLVVQNDDATQDCSNGGNYFSFIEAGDSLTEGSGSNRISYYYDATAEAIYRRIGNGDGDGATNENEDWLPITASNVRITDVEFVTTDSTTGTADGEQASVTIYVAGEAGQLAGVDSSFSMQTTMTQRPLDI